MATILMNTLRHRQARHGSIELDSVEPEERDRAIGRLQAEMSDQFLAGTLAEVVEAAYRADKIVVFPGPSFNPNNPSPYETYSQKDVLTALKSYPVHVILPEIIVRDAKDEAVKSPLQRYHDFAAALTLKTFNSLDIAGLYNFQVFGPDHTREWRLLHPAKTRQVHLYFHSTEEDKAGTAAADVKMAYHCLPIGSIRNSGQIGLPIDKLMHAANSYEAHNVYVIMDRTEGLVNVKQPLQTMAAAGKGIERLTILAEPSEKMLAFVQELKKIFPAMHLYSPISK